MPAKTDTDRYKLTMARAGFPLRRETFYLTLRKGGPHYVNFNVKAFVQELLSAALDVNNPLSLIGEFGDVLIQAVPKGSWVFDGEPIVKLTGPSEVVSYLEPLLLQMHWRIQASTDVALGAPAVFQTVNQEHEQALSELFPDIKIQTERLAWEEGIKSKFILLKNLLGSPERIFEVGLRGAINIPHHFAVLTVLREQGLLATSSCTSAEALGLASIGTMGHEHIMRCGSDEAAFDAMLGRVRGPVSLLVDTNDVFLSGIPAALRAMQNYPDRDIGFRFDSGDMLSQLVYAESRAKECGLTPKYVFEDGLDVQSTDRLEKMRVMLGIKTERVSRYGYGYGGFLNNPIKFKYVRDRVQAVYKVSQTGSTPVRKKTPGKESIGGDFDVWTPLYLTSANPPSFTGFVTQRGEDGPVDCISIFDSESPRRFLAAKEAVEVASRQKLILSERTKQIR